MVTESNYKKEMSTFQLNLMKGKVAETIIQNIFESTGFDVYPYGHESTLGKLKDNFENYKNHDDILKKIRFTPDFVVYDKEQEKAHLIEVKFNSSDKDEFQADYEKYCNHWPECHILVVKPLSKNKYYIQEASKLKPSKRFYNKQRRKEMFFYDINEFDTIQSVFNKIGLKTVKETFDLLDSLVKVGENNKD